ncbi:MAG: transcription antitermination factor NusB [Clostridiales bacterium]|uniref:Transcription antitermination protein NusB n=1 Tax=Harryflintia acetispora TaxID=1849041 RepID=A0A9X8Y8B6_9FIRM|nr:MULTISPECIES: transcription antitermination factor NusB [Oscillospiraceae]PWM41003.1 MAG: transcription antitermination factor NusB [Clostridiales bacterium]RGB66477.1 transcription antitermination factor NusB [Harryflintia acetispora]TCL43534.1 NusB antitermination factor [Harryflintia acetispora]
MTRSEARELAFILMFEKTFTDDSFEEIIEKATEGRELSLDRFAAELAQGTYSHLGELDELISKNSQNWKISRISRVALSALRVAVYEMLYERNIPRSVSINEAIELTKKFATPEDASFVNGVLGAVEKSLPPEEQKNTK